MQTYFFNPVSFRVLAVHFRFCMTMLPFMSTRFFRSLRNKPSMYLLINLEGVWEVKFELLNENVHVPPPPILLLYQCASCVSVQLTRKENISLSFSAVKKSTWKASVLTTSEASEKSLLMLYLHPISIFISVPCNSNPRSHYHSRIFFRLTVLQMLTFFDKQVTLSKHCKILPLICSMRGIGNQ